jgi:hypothetical protein
MMLVWGFLGGLGFGMVAGLLVSRRRYLREVTRLKKLLHTRDVIINDTLEGGV